MPALYALGQHPALLQAHAALTPGEDLYAYLDDICRWGMPRTSRERCDVSERSTTNVAFPRCHTCRAPGSSCSSARSLGAITCSAYCRPLTRESSLSPTTGPLPAAWGACSAARTSPSNFPSYRPGGLGLRSAAASRAAAYWPSSTASRRAELSPAPRRSARLSQPRTGAGAGRCSQSQRRERSHRRWRRVRQRAAGGRCPVRRPLGAGRVGTGRVFHPVSPRLDGKRSEKKKEEEVINEG